MQDKMLICDFELIPAGNGEVGMAFRVHNPNDHLVDVRYFKPFISFDLAAEANDGPVPLVQPAYDVGARPVSLSIGPGDTARIDTPIRLRFDPDVAPSGGDAPTRWTLRHAPAPLRLRVTLSLEGATVAPCEVSFDPAWLE